MIDCLTSLITAPVTLFGFSDLLVIFQKDSPPSLPRGFIVENRAAGRDVHLERRKMIDRN